MTRRSMLEPCMGGWCSEREICAHYRSQSQQEPAERLCDPGEALPVRRIVRPPGAWERPRLAGLMAPAGVWDGLG